MFGPSVCGGQVCLGGAAKGVCGPSVCLGQVCVWVNCVCGPRPSEIGISQNFISEANS